MRWSVTCSVYSRIEDKRIHISIFLILEILRIIFWFGVFFFLFFILAIPITTYLLLQSYKEISQALKLNFNLDSN